MPYSFTLHDYSYTQTIYQPLTVQAGYRDSTGLTLNAQPFHNGHLGHGGADINAYKEHWTVSESFWASYLRQKR